MRDETPTAAVADWNRLFRERVAGRPSAMDVGVQRAREGREAGLSVFGPLMVSDRAYDIEIPTVEGPVRGHVIEPRAEPSGVYLHIHGGGWVLGASHHHDAVNSRLVDGAGIVSVSIDYRLAPEHRYPANLTDCMAAARWVASNSRDRWGTDRIVIGGESAGAHLAALVVVDSPPGTFERALLNYGVYDITTSPSVRNWGSEELVLSTPIINWMIEHTFDAAVDLSDPGISPLYADLSPCCPARFVVGTSDPLLDDTLFMAARWQAAGHHIELDVFDDAIHAFDYFTDHPYTDLAIERAIAWLAS